MKVSVLLFAMINADFKAIRELDEGVKKYTGIIFKPYKINENQIF